uniref:ACPS domain-containing protein n=1 Tax=Macrostomum lignano TaxID=282301 RepID=A0A1I8FKT0_9PLAT
WSGSCSRVAQDGLEGGSGRVCSSCRFGPKFADCVALSYDRRLKTQLPPACPWWAPAAEICVVATRKVHPPVGSVRSEDSSVRLYTQDATAAAAALSQPASLRALNVSPLRPRTRRLSFLAPPDRPNASCVLLDSTATDCGVLCKSNPALQGFTPGLMKELHAALSASSGTAGLSIKTQELAKSQRASDYYQGGAGAAKIPRLVACAWALLRSHVIRWTLSSLALECPLAEELLLAGTVGWQGAFLDPTAPAGKLHLQLQAHRGPVTRLAWDEPH